MTLAEQLATLLEQGRDQPRHRADAAAELRRLQNELASPALEYVQGIARAALAKATGDAA